MDIKTLKTVRNNFLKELKAAKTGKETSLAFIVHQLPQTKIVKENEIFQVIVTGGTVCKEAKVKYQSGKLKILQKQEMYASTFKTKADFLEFIRKNLDEETKTLALNFTFPIKPILRDSRLDGVLISGTKEHLFDGLTGKKVGEEIENYILQKSKKAIKVAVANDTIALLLSALTQYSWNQIAAGVVGTGINFSIFLDSEQLVNLESGNFDKFPVSEETKQIDRQSTQKNKYLFEKETAGAYLFKQFDQILKNKNIQHKQITSTAQLNALANKNLGEPSEIARYLFEKSAGLVASAMAAITDFSQRDLVFVMEGSLFWHSLRPKIERYLKQLAPEYRTKFAKIEDSEILGAAKLVS
ncbi:MAG: hypothetical protein Q8P25_03110 [Candidatus Curtissbacteria bacterium]|nr:hypothetical protein [Candidatus Curtissbacteria bacterium]